MSPILSMLWRKINAKQGGGGSHENPHGFLGGVGQNSMFIHMGGRGGQKCPKNHPHGLWMFPYDDIYDLSKLGLL